MPVTLQAPYILDKIHLDYLYVNIEQTNLAKTSIKARVRLYAQDANGDKTFSPNAWDIDIHDVTEFVTSLAMGGDMRGVQANANMQSLVSLLVETQTPLGLTKNV